VISLKQSEEVSEAIKETVCGNCNAEYTKQGFCKHEEWCEKIARRIYSMYNRVFREIYNILELSLDENKARIAKDLAGNKLMKARNDSIRFVVNYFSKDSKI
jgi:hypothetical protein